MLWVPLVLAASLVAGQSSSPLTSTSLQLSTSFTTFTTTFAPQTVGTTVTQGVIVTIGGPSPSSLSGNATATNSGNATASSTKSQSPLPTAPTDVNGGGNFGAPSPGASSPGGIYGPGDGYIAAAASLRRNTFFVGAAGIVVGGLLVFV